jgi:hypothetical protein
MFVTDNNDLSISITVAQTPHDVYSAINNVRGWWSSNAHGKTSRLHDEFLLDFKRHWWAFKIIETIPGKKVVWKCTGSYMPWNEDEHEWSGTIVEFEIFQFDSKTNLKFTHKGLLPQCACFEGCLKGWTGYIRISLANLIEKGIGTPDTAY